MNPDTLHTIQVIAFVVIALTLVAMNVMLYVTLIEVLDQLPEIIDAIEAAGRRPPRCI